MKKVKTELTEKEYKKFLDSFQYLTDDQLDEVNIVLFAEQEERDLPPWATVEDTEFDDIEDSLIHKDDDLEWN